MHNKNSIHNHEKRPTTNRFHKNCITLSTKKTQFYPYYFILLPYVILQVTLYSMFYFICYMLYPSKLEFVLTRIRS